ncbi:EVE domain-containing protein [Azotobacter beijerinckii]|uniref:EVE domain-containing protein n=1 Tax=Azotobacter beijerinckii TaxID=170623 RepID=UPI002952EBC7|nr:EVE domain-containing protein [Azotobacter beijerinckii]MDV7211935.1 EVE domain-containing protein [Azotobacter beijerinckii]
MPYWLMKSEPGVLSAATLQRLHQTRWDGVRNYQARNFLRSMQADELFFFYHSSCPRPGIAGIGRIVRAAYPDPSALDPCSPYFDARASTVKNPWSAVDVEFVEAFAGIIDLACLRSAPGLAELPLLQKGSRLSVMPVDAGEWAAVLALR